MVHIVYSHPLTKSLSKVRIEGWIFENAINSHRVLNLISKDITNAGIIERKANSWEIDQDFSEIQLQKGYALIYKNKIFVELDELKNWNISTYLPENEIKDYTDYFGSIYHTNSLKESYKFIDQMPVLIPWDDYQDNFNLFVPINNNEIETRFITPFLYYKKLEKKDLETLVSIFNKKS